MGHAVFDPPAAPQILFADSVRKLDEWVQNKTPPDETYCENHPDACLAGGQFGLLKNCTALGFGGDPLGCFCQVMGGIDFAEQPTLECR